jgi:hypothetical protein
MKSGKKCRQVKLEEKPISKKENQKLNAKKGEHYGHKSKGLY